MGLKDPLFSWAPATGNGGYPPTLPKGAQFGLAVSAQNMPSGIFGAGYGAGFNQDYNSFIDEMYEQGLIEDKDFSVALGSIGTDDGMSERPPEQNCKTNCQKARLSLAVLIWPSSRGPFTN